MLSRMAIAFLPRSKHLLISWPQSLSVVILEPKKIKCLESSFSRSPRDTPQGQTEYGGTCRAQVDHRAPAVRPQGPGIWQWGKAGWVGDGTPWVGDGTPKGP